nr:MAG TPA: hypothetical protein [Caudoviricetes sp.]
MKLCFWHKKISLIINSTQIKCVVRYHYGECAFPIFT